MINNPDLYPDTFVGPLAPGHTYLLWSLGWRFTFRVCENGDWEVPAVVADNPFIPEWEVLRKCSPDCEIEVY